MTKENFNNTLENTEKPSVTSNKLKALKSAILWTLLSIVPINAIAQNNTSTDSTKSKTEVVNNNIPSLEQIKAKHKITDINTATIEQLQSCYKDLNDLLEDPEGEEGPKIIGKAREPYVRLRWEIWDLIEDRERNKKMEEETKKIKAKAALSTKMVEALKWKKTEQ